MKKFFESNLHKIIAIILLLPTIFIHTENEGLPNLKKCSPKSSNNYNISGDLNIYDCGDDKACEALCAPIEVTGAGNLSTYGHFASGVYCLTKDLHSELIIDTSNIILDLNGHKISNNTAGIIVNSDLENITIRNGIIKSGNSPEGLATGIDMTQGGNNFILQNLTISGWAAGVFTTNVNTMFVKDSLFNNNILGGFGFINSQNGKFQNCTFTNNRDLGISISTQGSGIVRDVFMENCQFQQEEGYGAVLIGGPSSCIQIDGCSACFTGTNPGTTNGFQIASGDPSDIILKNCTAENFAGGAGFYISGNIVYLSDCIAQNNKAGFAADSSASYVTMQNCNASKNSIIGFVDLGPSDVNNNTYYSNIACGNGMIDYYGVLSAPISSPAGARGVDNISCSISNSSCEATPIGSGTLSN